MRKYRIVQFVNGDFGIQTKKGFFSFWHLLPFDPILDIVHAEIAVNKLAAKQKEDIEKQKLLKIARVYKKPKII